MSRFTCPNCGLETAASWFSRDGNLCPACRTEVSDDRTAGTLAAADVVSDAPSAKTGIVFQELPDVPETGSKELAGLQPSDSPSEDEYPLLPPEVSEPARATKEPRRRKSRVVEEAEPTFFCLPLLCVLGPTLAGMLFLCPLSMFLEFPKGLLTLWGIGLIFGGIFWVGFRFKRFTGEYMQDEAPWYFRGGLAVMLQLTGYVIQEPVIFGPPFSVLVLGGLLCVSPIFIPDMRGYLNRPPANAAAPPLAAAVNPPNDEPRAAAPASRKESRSLKELLAVRPVVYLTDLEEFDVQAGPCPIGKNGELGNGSRITVEKKEIPKGLGMHPPDPPALAKANFRVDKQRLVLSGGVALNDTAETPWGAAIFKVHGDGALLWKSPPIKSRGKVTEFRLDLENIEVLQLSVEVEGHSHYVHAVWVEPRVTRKD